MSIQSIEDNKFHLLKNINLTEEQYVRLRNEVISGGIFEFIQRNSPSTIVKLITEKDLMKDDSDSNSIRRGLLIKNVFDEEDEELNLAFGTIEISETEFDENNLSNLSNHSIKGLMKCVDIDMENINDSDYFTPVYFETVEIILTKDLFSFNLEYRKGVYSNFVERSLCNLFVKILDELLENFIAG